ncbi:MAG: hypothetical protein U9Q07_07035 [Planctomycetota bacterium]|nr:hypothetical protein [Planctomycetota bacterium]
MRDEEPDILDALEGHDFEYESADDFSDLEHESDITELDDEDAFDEYSAYFDYDH